MDNPKSSNSPPPPATTTTTISGGGNKKAVENLKSLVMKCATKQLTPPQKTFIENRIQELVPTINTTTPDHPSYALMIENAIKQLNEEGRGSSEDAISNFILNQFNNNKNNKLGWAHSALLKHHLVNLCESGNLVITSPQGFYALTTGGGSRHNRRSSSPLSSSTTSSTSCSESDDPSFTPIAVKGRRRNNIKSNKKSTPQSRRKSTNKFKGSRRIK
ncbi:hypothetical protein ABFS82_12G067400 [Erythranthe guttata]|uniref:uncharacterized protein LOC105964138 n=1 Tax=Erythranthe guttata TaxID=4155 RepID=UPI00064DB4BC|nr:PREDICTED: uncharacterized protein LOC105964138 [Erythranthe guttata]|eukprot:XP_012844104.1 PREDICTED: uncharacterized protein LOC105964138 [Erythranthe guttata]